MTATRIVAIAVAASLSESKLMGGAHPTRSLLLTTKGDTMARMKNRDANRNRREDRIVQAKIRQEAYDKLTVSEKIDALGSSRSLVQRAKLVKLLEKEVVQEDKELMRSLVAEVTEGVEALVKERKGAKARKQAKKDKKAS